MSEAFRIHVVVEHPTMRHLVTDLLGCVHDCAVTSASLPTELDLERDARDLLVIDESSFAQADWRDAAADVATLVLVVAPENDPSSREAALAEGAHGWLPRERLGEELQAEILRMISTRGDTMPSAGGDEVVLPTEAQVGSPAMHLTGGDL
jgi:DNA-binding NarL/FixJ family response regulator